MATRFKSCAADGCKRNSHYTAKGARGFCSLHYERFMLYGDPLSGRSVRGDKLAWLLAHKNYSGDECLIWPFKRMRTGYGEGVSQDGKLTLPHRLICIFSHGEPPPGKYDCAHSCGRGHEGCVNPRHLRWATRLENSADKIVHGSQPRGQNHYISKLTEMQVREIRALRGRMFGKDIAKLYGVCRGSIVDIFQDRTWAWLDRQQVAVERMERPRNVGNHLTAWQWRRLVCARVGFICQRCGETQRKKIDAHHIHARSQKPEDRTNPDNGVALCKECHVGFHSKYGMKDFGREQLEEYLSSGREPNVDFLAGIE